MIRLQQLELTCAVNMQADASEMPTEADVAALGGEYALDTPAKCSMLQARFHPPLPALLLLLRDARMHVSLCKLLARMSAQSCTKRYRAHCDGLQACRPGWSG